MTLFCEQQPSSNRIPPLPSGADRSEVSISGEQNIESAAKFWGHLGLRFSGQAKSKWYPISSEVADRVRQNVKRSQNVSEWIVVETMNNHTLAFRPMQVHRIWLLDDTCAAPEGDFDREAPWHDWEGLPPEMYLAMAEWADRAYGNCSEKGDPISAFSRATYKTAVSVIKQAGLADRPEDVRAALRHTTVHFTNGSTTQYEVNREDLLELVELDAQPDIQLVEISACDRDFESFYPTSALTMIDIPTIELNAVRLEMWGSDYLSE